MPDPTQLTDQIVLRGTRSVLYEATEKATTVTELQATLAQVQAALAGYKATSASSGDKIRAGIQQQKGGSNQ